MKKGYVGYYKRMVIKANKEVVSPIEACMLDKKEALKTQAKEILNWYFNELNKRDHVLACKVGALALERFLKT